MNCVQCGGRNPSNAKSCLHCAMPLGEDPGLGAPPEAGFGPSLQNAPNAGQGQSQGHFGAPPGAGFGPSLSNNSSAGPGQNQFNAAPPGGAFGKTTVTRGADGVYQIRGLGGTLGALAIMAVVGFLIWFVATGRYDRFMTKAGFDLHYKAVICDSLGLSSTERAQARAAGMRRDFSEESSRRRTGTQRSSTSRWDEECWSVDFGPNEPESSQVPSGARVKTYYSKSSEGGE